MFYIIGLGLSDEKDITLRGLEVGHTPLHSSLASAEEAAGD